MLAESIFIFIAVITSISGQNAVDNEDFFVTEIAEVKALPKI